MTEIELHYARLKQIGCKISRRQPVQIHHCRSGSMANEGFSVGIGQKASHWLTIPLHVDYHVGDQGIHKIGVKTWEAHYGRQVDLLDEISKMLGYNVWKLAGIDREVAL